MGMWPTATLTYGYDIEPPDADWAESDEPDEAAARLLADAGDLPDYVRVHRDYDGCHLRLIAASMTASGWNARATAETLELPEDADAHLRRAAELLGIELTDTQAAWLLYGEFN